MLDQQFVNVMQGLTLLLLSGALIMTAVAFAQRMQPAFMTPIILALAGIPLNMTEALVFGLESSIMFCWASGGVALFALIVSLFTPHETPVLIRPNVHPDDRIDHELIAAMARAHAIQRAEAESA